MTLEQLRVRNLAKKRKSAGLRLDVCTACFYRSYCSNLKETRHLPNWPKLLAILTLMMLGLPAVASAHCEHPSDGDNTIAVVETVPDAVVAQSAGEWSTPTRSDYLFEASQTPSQKSCCIGSCCCQGMSHCGSSGGSSMFTGSSSLVVPKLDTTRVAHFEDQVLKHLDPTFGLERPPRG